MSRPSEALSKPVFGRKSSVPLDSSPGSEIKEKFKRSVHACSTGDLDELERIEREKQTIKNDRRRERRLIANKNKIGSRKVKKSPWVLESFDDSCHSYTARVKNQDAPELANVVTYDDDVAIWNDELIRQQQDEEMRGCIAENQERGNYSGPQRNLCFCLSAILVIVLIGGSIAILISDQIQKTKKSTVSFSERETFDKALLDLASSDIFERSVCKQACRMARCCSSPSHDSQECDRKNEASCEKYNDQCKQYCKTYESLFGGAHSSLKGWVSSICSSENIKDNEGMIYCQNLCAPYMCCFMEYNKGCEHDANKCNLFSPCSFLTAPYGFESINGNKSDASVCSVESIASDEGFGLCQKACSSRACCFLSEKHPGNCYTLDSEWCNEYKYCLNLLEVEPIS